MHAVWLASLTKNISQQILLNILFGVRDRISVHIVHKESEWKRKKGNYACNAQAHQLDFMHANKFGYHAGS